MSEPGAQSHGAGRRSRVKPSDSAGPGQGARGEPGRPGPGEDTGPAEPGRRPEPQDQTKHVAAEGKTTRSC